MANAYIEWKCRRCGKIEISGASPNAKDGLQRFLDGNEYTSCTSHPCQDGGFGVMDIVGSFEVKEA